MTRAVTAMTDVVPFIGLSSLALSSLTLSFPEKCCDCQCSADPYGHIRDPDPALAKNLQSLFIYFEVKNIFFLRLLSLVLCM